MGRARPRASARIAGRVVTERPRKEDWVDEMA